jgi:hypothetical protein
MTKFILTPAITFAIMYLFIAFIKMDFNAFEWGEDIRVSYVVISTILSIVAIVVYLNEKK